MAPRGKELSEDLKKRIVALRKDGLGYKKIAKTLNLSCSTVAKTTQRLNRTGSTRNRPRHGGPKKLSARAQRHIQRLALGNRRMSAASIAAEVAGVEGQPVSAQTIHRTLHQINGVKRVWRQPGEEYKDKCVLPTVKHGGGSAMVWGCMSAAGNGELQSIEGTLNASMSCDILKQSTIPSLRRLGRRAVFQHDHDSKHTSKMTAVLLKKLRVKVKDSPSMFPDLSPIEHLWGIRNRKVEERKVSNIHQLRDVVMEEWKRTPAATCEALVNSMPKRVQTVLENNAGHTKY
ncbi:Transposable element Tcb1 transposase [Varanus komodoensis]|nr:Transposable element Tcb1 transposase [Varanus komodoensis]